MAAFVESGEQAGREASALYRNVTCPFCGIHCDDLEVGRTDRALQVRRNGCPKANPNFERQLPRAGPAVRRQTGEPGGGDPRRRRSHPRGAAAPLRRARHRRRRHARGDGARRPRRRRRRPRAERRARPQCHGAADERLDHLDADRGAQPGRPFHHRRQTCTGCTRASSSASSAPTSRCSTRCRRSAPSSSSARASTLPARRGRVSAR